jgi:hypothetical protein
VKTWWWSIGARATASSILTQTGSELRLACCNAALSVEIALAPIDGQRRT